MLDLPMIIPKNSNMDKDYITRSRQPLFQSYQYNGRPALSYSSETQEDSNLKKAPLVDTTRALNVYIKMSKSTHKREKDILKAHNMSPF